MVTDKGEIREKLKEMIMDRIRYDREMTDEEIREIVDDAIIQNGRELSLTLKDKQELSKDLFYAIRRLDILQELTDDPKVTEIMINGYDRIFIEKQGRLAELDKHFFNSFLREMNEFFKHFQDMDCDRLNYVEFSNYILLIYILYYTFYYLNMKANLILFNLI